MPYSNVGKNGRFYCDGFDQDVYKVWLTIPPDKVDFYEQLIDDCSYHIDNWTEMDASGKSRVECIIVIPTDDYNKVHILFDECLGF